MEKEKNHSEITKFIDSYFSKIIYSLSILILIGVFEYKIIFIENIILKSLFLILVLFIWLSIICYTLSWIITQNGATRVMNKEINDDKIIKINNKITFLNLIYQRLILLSITIVVLMIFIFFLI